MTRKRRIAFVTGTRADYGLLSPVMRAARADSKLTPQVIVTGMHLVKRFGHTIDEIRADGWPIAARVPMQTGRDTKLAQARALAKGVSGIAESLEKLRSDIVVVLGDRVEALAGALAATATDRFCAHIHGGDVAPGHLDDAFRHAVTKLAHFHFAASRDAAQRIIKLGEHSKQVYVVGAPGLDDLLKIKQPPKGWFAERFGFDRERDVALVIQHPIGRPAQAEKKVMNAILRAVAARRLNGLLIYPNSDPGHSGIISAIRDQVRKGPRGSWVASESLPRDDFLRCLLAARVLLGNSSCGIIEAPAAGTAVVNVGARQYARLRSAGRVIDSVETSKAIHAAIQKALKLPTDRVRGGVYGTGRAGRQIARHLASTPLSDNLKRKRISY